MGAPALKSPGESSQTCGTDTKVPWRRWLGAYEPDMAFRAFLPMWSRRKIFLVLSQLRVATSEKTPRKDAPLVPARRPPRRRSLPPPHLAGPRGAGRQAAARRGSVGFVCSESVSSSGHGALIVPRGTDTFPLLSDHRRHSGGDDVTHSANGKHVTPPGQSEQRTPGLGGWCDLGQVTPSELRYGEESESISAGSGLRACEPSSP